MQRNDSASTPYVFPQPPQPSGFQAFTQPLQQPILMPLGSLPYPMLIPLASLPYPVLIPLNTAAPFPQMSEQPSLPRPSLDQVCVVKENGTYRLFDEGFDCGKPFEYMDRRTFKLNYTFISVVQAEKNGRYIRAYKVEKPGEIFEVTLGEFKAHNRAIKPVQQKKRTKGKEKIDEQKPSNKRSRKKIKRVVAKLPVADVVDYREEEPEETVLHPAFIPSLEVPSAATNASISSFGSLQEVPQTYSPTLAKEEILTTSSNDENYYLDTEEQRSVLAKKLNFRYIIAKQDRPDLLYAAPLSVISREKAHPQFAAYARQNIPKNTILCAYTGETFTPAQWERKLNQKKKHDTSYAMYNAKEGIIDALKAGNIGRFFNHSKQANAQFCKKEGYKNKSYVVIQTTRNIAANEQLLVDYGDDYQFGYVPFHLHFTDNADSTENILIKNRAAYEKISLEDTNLNPQTITCLGLKKDGTYYLPKTISDQLTYASLDHLADDTNANLAALEINSENQSCLPQYGQERVTGLMLACYLGNKENVQWLMNHQADLAMQQLKSGNSALHFLMLGSESETNIHKKQQRLSILDSVLKTNHRSCFLIRNINNQTPLHVAIKHADLEYLFRYLRGIKKPRLSLNNHGKAEMHPIVFAILNNKLIHARAMLFFTVEKKQETMQLRNSIMKVLATDTDQSKVLREGLVQVLNDIRARNKATPTVTLFAPGHKIMAENLLNDLLGTQQLPQLTHQS